MADISCSSVPENECGGFNVPIPGSFGTLSPVFQTKLLVQVLKYLTLVILSLTMTMECIPSLLNKSMIPWKYEMLSSFPHSRPPSTWKWFLSSPKGFRGGGWKSPNHHYGVGLSPLFHHYNFVSSPAPPRMLLRGKWILGCGCGWDALCSTQVHASYNGMFYW